MLGEISLSRSTLTADIYFIYVFENWPDCGNGANLHRWFEDIVMERSAFVGVKVAILIRMPIKHCIVHSIVIFWRKLGFEGSEDSICFTRTTKCN